MGLDAPLATLRSARVSAIEPLLFPSLHSLTFDLQTLCIYTTRQLLQQLSPLPCSLAASLPSLCTAQGKMRPALALSFLLSSLATLAVAGQDDPVTLRKVSPLPSVLLRTPKPNRLLFRRIESS